MTAADTVERAVAERSKSASAGPPGAKSQAKTLKTTTAQGNSRKVVPEPRALKWLPFPEVPAPSNWPLDKGDLDIVDKALSKRVWMLQLSRSAEVVLSIPGCFFSMPAFLALGPSLLMLACSDGEDNRVLAAVVSCGGCALLAIWASALKSERPLRGHLYSPLTVLCSPLLGMLLPALLGGADASRIRGLANFYIVSWVAIDIPIMVCKNIFRRRRPVACPVAYLGTTVVAAACKKHLSFLGRMLLHLDANGSFPSGDVAGAVAFAFALWYGGAGLVVSCTCVLLCGFARVYWQAHHLLDVVAGCLVAIASCWLLVMFEMMYGIGFVQKSDEVPDCGAVCNARWWHFLVAQAAHTVAAEHVKNWNKLKSGACTNEDVDFLLTSDCLGSLAKFTLKGPGIHS